MEVGAGMATEPDFAANVRLADAEAIAEAGRLLRQGRLVAFPTETVYGLGADATNDDAVAAIFAAKGRPNFNPLIVHVADVDAAARLAELGPVALRLARAFWPGPLTLVAPRKAGAGVSALATAGLDTVAVRVPANPLAHALLVAAGVPVAAPSANRSGHVSPTLAAHVAADLGDRVAMVLDGGATTHGLESTVVDVSGDRVTLLRLGSITAQQLAAVTGQDVQRATEAAVKDGIVAPQSPGQLLLHYAPRARVRLNVTEPRPGEGFLAFGSIASEPRHDGPTINLSPAGDLTEAARALYASLRSLDDAGVDSIAVMPIPHDGIGEAINDRLNRAAAPRVG